MKIVFFGTPQIAGRVLQYLIDQKLDIVMCVTKPDKPLGRSSELKPPPVKIVANNYQIPVMQPEKVSTQECQAILEQLKPDLFVVVAYGEIIKQFLLDIPSFGSINLHASLLPKYRGAAPIQRALTNGEKETGVSIIKLVKKMDAGPILVKDRLIIPENMNSVELFDALETLGKKSILKAITQIKEGVSVEEVQDESQVTFAAKLEPKEYHISLSLPLKQVHNLIRGLYPNAYILISLRGINKKIKLLNTVTHVSTPKLDKKRFFIEMDDGALEVLTLQQEGKRVMTAEEWLMSAYGQFKIL
ncbi:methionyl-tRNA formyltransferase [Chlamydiales bacterium]|nr:methionyl-tRNA formyltransferase [Chlamydiales bacterium]